MVNYLKSEMVTAGSPHSWRLLGAMVAMLGAAQASPAIAAELTGRQMREDLVYLRDVWAPMDKSFSPDRRKQFEDAVNSAIARADSLTAADFSLEISKAVALAGNGHTEANVGPYFHGLPFKAAWFADGLYIVRTHPQYVGLLGARIDRLGALSAIDALKRVSPFIPGTEAHIRVLSPGFLRLLEVLHRIGATESDEKAPISLTLRNGKRQSVVLREEPSGDPEFLPPYQQLIRMEGDGNPPDRWPDILDSVQHVSPAYQRRANLMTEWIEGQEGVFYVKIDLTVDPPPGTRSPIDDIISGKPRCIVIDLRFNPGGNFASTIIFSQALPKIAPKAKIFVLVGPGTFSAALVTAAMLKRCGGEQVALVGDTMGDRPNFWAEGTQISLPNSHIQVRYASGYQDWGNGCDDLSRCFWLNVVYGEKNISLEPQIKVITTFNDYAAGRDPELEAALRTANLTE